MTIGIGVENQYALIFGLVVLFMLVLDLSRCDPTNHCIAFFLPWLAIIIFSFTPISELAKPLSGKTYLVVLTFLSSYIIGTFFAKFRLRHNQKKQFEDVLPLRWDRLRLFFWLYLLLTFLNIILAGYIPLVRLIQVGDSGYMEFGITGIYGFYNAFANAFAIFSLYGYLTLKKKRLLIYYLVVIVFFILFITRMNIVSLLVETFIVYSIVIKKVHKAKIIFYFLILLSFFSLAGNLRTGSIKDIAEVNSQYEWVPDSMVWLYSYSYFNILNLDNLISNTPAPYYDLSSLSGLVPNFMRGKIWNPDQHDSFLEKENFTVSSAVSSLYADSGIFSLVMVSFIMGFLTQRHYRGMIQIPNVTSICIYSVLYYCALFSFFVNFWFFLPIIFQIPIFLFLGRSIRYSKCCLFKNNKN